MFFKKKKIDTEPIHVPESKYSKIFDQEISKLKNNVSKITEEMKKAAISSLLSHINKLTIDALETGKKDFMIVSPHINNPALVPLKLEDEVFKAIVQDMAPILREKGLKNVEFGSGWIRLQVDDLKKFSNYENLGALK